MRKQTQETSYSEATRSWALRRGFGQAGTSRRDALASLLALFSSLVSCVSPRSRRQGDANGDNHLLEDAAQARLAQGLSQDLARLSERAYSEEGIPVFLVCEDVAGDGKGRKADPNRSTDPAIQTAFQESAHALALVRPEATEEDVSKLIEVLADRDFGICLTP